jgi:hypothetical protein
MIPERHNLKDHITHPVFKQIGKVSDMVGVETYVVGGFVRDVLLGRDRKVYDIDIVTVGSGIDLATKVATALRPGLKVTVFKNFGTAMFRFNDIDFEFVGARRESYQHDSRKPIVEDGTLEDDQKRRDFTINALAICLNNNRYGELLDPFDGIGDLENKIIKTPLAPEITFSDDPLRMLRAIRFATQLDFMIASESKFFRKSVLLTKSIKSYSRKTHPLGLSCLRKPDYWQLFCLKFKISKGVRREMGLVIRIIFIIRSKFLTEFQKTQTTYGFVGRRYSTISPSRLPNDLIRDWDGHSMPIIL